MLNKLRLTLALLLGFGVNIALAQGKAEKLSPGEKLATEDFNQYRAKGQFHTGLTFSFSTRNAKNEDQIIQTVLDQRKYDFSMGALGGYFIKDNFSVGLGFGYNRGENERTIQGDPNNTLAQSLNQSYVTTAFIRNYLPLDGQGRFALFNQTNFYYENGKRLNVSTVGPEINKSLTDFHEIGLGIQPGMVAFISDGFSFEVSVGLLGLNVSKETGRENYEEVTEITRSNFDFRISLLQLNMGVSYYF
ncbi:outer membrane beta-barrel protein [Persicobacter sp. CCB-QB2]|uniref:outer membrane beta-barrel protein n=1 Tax=Persicobacter sp. CCB-QB2 TaxID=1561025 RepID=UPI0006A9594C|nr:outer membrane beta-barrel protein [Persicobacter sp. CCB-QB2]